MWYNSRPFAQVVESAEQKHRTYVNLLSAYNQGAVDAVEELNNVAPYYMDALDRERTLAEANEYLKKSLKAIYALQSDQTDKMWTLINDLFDRSDPMNPSPSPMESDE